MTLVDRSRITCQHRCPRERFLRYHCRHQGIQPARLNLALSTGITVHLGVQALLEGKSTEIAIEEALDYWESESASKEIESEVYEDQLEIVNETKALISAMLWTYYYVAYPKLIEEYDIVATEKEINWNLTDEIVMMARVDAVLRNKETGMLCVYDLKTASSYSDDQVRRDKFNDQGISELLSVEAFYKESVDHIKKDYLIKGVRRSTKDKATGAKKKYTDTPLLHPYKMDSGLNVSYEPKYEWTDSEGKTHRLGRNWSRCNIWEDMHMQQWVEFLMGNSADVLESQIISPYPYHRNSDDINDWLEQNITQEKAIASALVKLSLLDENLPGPRESKQPIYRKALNETFPYRREACWQYGHFCEMTPVCWEGEPTTSSLYTFREPHHEAEKKIYTVSPLSISINK